MLKTVDYIELLRERTQTRSDYAVAKFLGVSEDAINQYRKGKRAMSPDVALLIAEKLQLPILEVLADGMAEHAKTPEMRKKWRDVRKLWAQVVRVGLIALCAAPWRPTLPHGENRTEAWTLYSESAISPHNFAGPRILARRRDRKTTPTADGVTIMRQLGRSLWRSLRQHWGNSRYYPTPCAFAP